MLIEIGTNDLSLLNIAISSYEDSLKIGLVAWETMDGKPLNAKLLEQYKDLLRRINREASTQIQDQYFQEGIDKILGEGL